MYSKFKKNQKVIVYGLGENKGKFYNNVPGVIIERDPYFKDYHVKFINGTEDWLLKDSLKETYQRENKKGD